jgi:sarcosine oxidase subunit beta
MITDLPSTADVVIIGGGVMGSSTAYHLVLAGMKEVVLLEREPFFGQGATGRCAGGVRYQFATEVNIRLSTASLPMLERFYEETGQDCNYHKCGYLFVLTHPDEVEAFKHSVSLQHSLSVNTTWLTGDEVRRRLPFMRFEDALAGTFHDQDGLADPNSVIMGYIKRARHLGAQTLTEVEVHGIEVSGGRVTGVHTDSGSISCRSVVNAAGPWAGVVGEMAGVEIPIKPVRRQIVTTTPLPDLPVNFPFVIDFTQSLYFHREGDGILTGMSNPNQGPGFDQSIDKEWELHAMQAAIERLPMLEHAGRLASWAGLYEVTPDSHPILGPTPTVGFWVVAGFSGHGFMHGPIAGKLMSEFIIDGEAQTVDVSMLDLARLKENHLIQEYNVV